MWAVLKTRAGLVTDKLSVYLSQENIGLHFYSFNLL